MRIISALRMATGKVLEGVFAINKPTGMSSAQVIRDCQEVFNPSKLFQPLIEQEKAARKREPHHQKNRRGKIKQLIRVKMGHGGTLDPLASGILVLGVGKGTKSLPSFLDCTKTYETIVLFGASTDTYDRVGKIIKKGKYDGLTKAAVEEALQSFRGKFKQMPPLFSALKMEGKKLYEYAKEGKPLPRAIETREVVVTELELVEWYEPGTHDHRWPTEEADNTAKKAANMVLTAARKQAKDQGLPSASAVEQDEDSKEHIETNNAAEENEEVKAEDAAKGKKRSAEDADDVDGNNPAKFQKHDEKSKSSKPIKPTGGRGSNLLPPPHDPNSPPPWTDKGPPAAKIRMTVTSGFYVRSLAHDLGEKLGSGAMMAELIRSRQRDFVLGSGHVLEYEDIEKGEDVWGPKVSALLSAWQNKGKAQDGAQEADPNQNETAVDDKDAVAEKIADAA